MSSATSLPSPTRASSPPSSPAPRPPTNELPRAAYRAYGEEVYRGDDELSDDDLRERERELASATFRECAHAERSLARYLAGWFLGKAPPLFEAEADRFWSQNEVPASSTAAALDWDFAHEAGHTIARGLTYATGNPVVGQFLQPGDDDKLARPFCFDDDLPFCHEVLIIGTNNRLILSLKLGD